MDIFNTITQRVLGNDNLKFTLYLLAIWCNKNSKLLFSLNYFLVFCVSEEKNGKTSHS